MRHAPTGSSMQYKNSPADLKQLWKWSYW